MQAWKARLDIFVQLTFATVAVAVAPDFSTMTRFIQLTENATGMFGHLFPQIPPSYWPVAKGHQIKSGSCSKGQLDIHALYYLAISKPTMLTNRVITLTGFTSSAQGSGSLMVRWAEGCEFNSRVHQAATAGSLSKALTPWLLSCIKNEIKCNSLWVRML